jgi:hypothetical protein
MLHLKIGLWDDRPLIRPRTAIQKAPLPIVMIAASPRFMQILENGIV